MSIEICRVIAKDLSVLLQDIVIVRLGAFLNFVEEQVCRQFLVLNDHCLRRGVP